jgi:6-phospho-beta-glucosidase
MRPLKIVVIGGGSSYTPELAEGIILHRDTLPVKELILVDVPMGEEKVKIITAFVRRMFEEAKAGLQGTESPDTKYYGKYSGGNC